MLRVAPTTCLFAPRKALAAVSICATVAAMALAFSTATALATGDANRAQCGNANSPGFRSYLADCRGYEMVSPPYKEGEPMSIGGVFRISSNGEHVISQSLGVFAGAENDILDKSVGTQYESSLASPFWTTTALAPAAAPYTTGSMLDASPSDETSLWSLQETGQPINLEELYLRSGAGTFERIGPGNDGLTRTPATGEEASTAAQLVQYRGASPSFSHILISAESDVANSPLWPGDTTITAGPVPSLYEYEGTGNSEPRLVGVSGGPLDGATHVNEGAHLISNCGTVLGGQEGSTHTTTLHSAISETGESVIFTALGSKEMVPCESAAEKYAECEQSHTKPECEATEGPPPTAPPVNEVYLRFDASSTISISEPPLSTPGRHCTGKCEEDETNLSHRSEAVFEGASRDGHNIFIRTAQPLVNNDEDETDDLYEIEVSAGHVSGITMLSAGGEGDPAPGKGAEVLGVVAVSEDGSHVYFAARGLLTDRPNGDGEKAQAGANNLYQYSGATGQVAFVGRLDASGDSGLWAAGEGPAVTTPDGAFLVFQSGADLTAGDTSSEEAPQIFEYAAASGELSRVSIGSSGVFPCSTTNKVEAGFNCDGNVTSASTQPLIVRPSYRESDSPSAATTFLSMSANGAIVVFTSHDALTPGATQGVNNIYEYTGEDVYLVSDGHDAAEARHLHVEASELLGMDETGKNIYFITADQLVPQDTDTEADIYDAREGGGPPASVGAAECATETCLGAPSPPLAASPSASQLTPGEAPLPPPSPLPPPKLTRAQKLAKALKTCKAQHHRAEKALRKCDAHAKALYGAHSKKASHKRSAKR
jgi:hypothetical protein